MAIHQGVLFVWPSPLVRGEEPPSRDLIPGAPDIPADQELPGSVMRDMPVDMPLLLENILDPDHGEWAHCHFQGFKPFCFEPGRRSSITTVPFPAKGAAPIPTSLVLGKLSVIEPILQACADSHHLQPFPIWSVTFLFSPADKLSCCLPTSVGRPLQATTVLTQPVKVRRPFSPLSSMINRSSVSSPSLGEAADRAPGCLQDGQGQSSIPKEVCLGQDYKDGEEVAITFKAPCFVQWDRPPSYGRMHGSICFWVVPLGVGRSRFISCTNMPAFENAKAPIWMRHVFLNSFLGEPS